MKKPKWIPKTQAITLLWLALAGSVESQDITPIANQSQSSPEAVLVSYFNAINQQNNELAYSYWDRESGVQKTSSLAQFMHGYADTTSVVEAYFRLRSDISEALGTTWGKVAVILRVLHKDHTRHHCVGCYMTRQNAVHVGEPPVQDWNFCINEGSRIEATDAFDGSHPIISTKQN